MQAWLTGTLDIDLGSLPPGAASSLQSSLTLMQDGFTGSEPVAYFECNRGWMHIPRGFWWTPEGAVLHRASLQDGRSDGFPLPPGTKANVVFGQPPFPPGQPAFIANAVAATLSNGHGGLLSAPTRSGKTLCAVEIACRLGGSTLILGDSVELLGQWQDEIEKHVGVPVGVIREGRFDYGPQWPFVVATVQTLVRRRIPDEARRSFRTLIVDECNSAPCSTVWSAIRRFYARYVLGLTATPDRGDGLSDAISWIIGPTIATLERQMTADVHFLHVPWRACKIPREDRNGTIRNYKPVLKRNGKTSWVTAEQSLMRDDERMAMLVGEVLKGRRAGYKPLVMVGLRDHGERWVEALRGAGLDVGSLMGSASRSEGAKEAVVATYKKAGRGLTIMPPADLFVGDGPVRDIRQAVGRSLQPQATRRTLILDPVDMAPELIAWARVRRSFYMERGFGLRNGVMGP